MYLFGNCDTHKFGKFAAPYFMCTKQAVSVLNQVLKFFQIKINLFKRKSYYILLKCSENLKERNGKKNVFVKIPKNLRKRFKLLYFYSVRIIWIIRIYSRVESLVRDSMVNFKYILGSQETSEELNIFFRF